MATAVKVDKQTEKILQTLCEEIKSHKDEYNARTSRKGSFAKSILTKTKMDKAMLKSPDSPSTEKELDFADFRMEGMDDLSLSSDTIDYLEYADSETNLEDSLSESLNEGMSEDEAIEAIISAINRMAMKIDNDPNISRLLEKTTTKEQSSINFSTFNSLVIRLIEDVSPGIAVDSWGNAMFLMIIALKLSELKQYPQDFFKRYVYDKIVPWVTEQPGGWMAAKDDDKVGKIVQKAYSRQVSVPVRERSDSSASDYHASSPSSLLSWFSFPKRSRSFHSDSSFEK